MTVKKVKINIEYRYNDKVVKVVKRVKNSYTEKWFYGHGTKHQKISHRKETTFILNNGLEVFARDLTLLT